MQPEQTDLSRVMNDEEVLRFLATNPEFFVHNQDILSRLRIPHQAGKAVSLIEKQVSVLRGKCSTLEHSLRDLIAVARENESLHQRLHGLIQDIISAGSLEEIVGLTRLSLKENFNADEVHLLLFAARPKRSTARRKSPTGEALTLLDADTVVETAVRPARAAAAKVVAKSTRTRRPRAIEGVQIKAHDDPSLELFSELFDSGETECGLPAAEHLGCFVGKAYANIASAALIPLQHERPLGVIMLTSRDESRFASGKGVMFLNQLGQLLSRRLHTYGDISAAVKK